MDKLKELLPLLAKRLIDRETDSGSSDDEVDLHILKRIESIEQNLKATKPVDYMQRVDQYSDAEFKKRFRVSRKTFDLLLNIVETDIYEMVLKGSRVFTPHQQLLLTLCKMTSSISYRSLSRKFKLGRLTANRTVHKVAHALFRRASQFIKWPTPYSERLKVMKEFETLSGFPHIIGVIDDIHIRIPKPFRNSEHYLNGKRKHSMHLQVVCDHNSLIIHCATGEPGSVTDQAVFEASGMKNLINDGRKFPGEALLIGDQAYKLHPRLMTPFRKKRGLQLTEEQVNYNKHHSVAHQAVIRCSQLLRGRMRSLLATLPITRVKLIPEYIVACCVIHNICIMQGDIIDIKNVPPIKEPNWPVVYGDSNVGRKKRLWIMNSLKMRD